MKKKQSTKEPAVPKKGSTSSLRKSGNDPSSTASAGGSKSEQRTSKFKEQTESLKNSK